MAAKIFINYRRDDVPGDARNIRDSLFKAFGKPHVFMDVDNLFAGQRFDKELAKALDQCDVLLAIIGPHWMELFRARSQGADRDYVREEIAAALKRGITVIPVRVGREGQLAPLPHGGDLPEDIRDLSLHQRHDVVHEHAGRDCEALVTAIRAMRRPRPGGSGQSVGALGWAGGSLAAAAVLAAGIASWAFWPVSAPVSIPAAPNPTLDACGVGVSSRHERPS